MPRPPGAIDSVARYGPSTPPLRMSGPGERKLRPPEALLQPHLAERLRDFRRAAASGEHPGQVEARRREDLDLRSNHQGIVCAIPVAIGGQLLEPAGVTQELDRGVEVGRPIR